MRTTRLRITLRDVEPALVRVIDVPAGATLPELHDLLQAALGWTDSHLHEFTARGARYGVPDPDRDDLQVQDEAAVRLRDLPARFEYLYDFGDGWEHDGLRKWAGELPSFDREATGLLVRQTVGEVPESVRLLLDLLVAGVKLTPGGRLPRSVVRAMQERRPEWCPSDRPASIEEDLIPLTVLHEILRRVGLARLVKGVLSPTRAAADDREIVRRLRTWFEPEGFRAVLGGVAVAALAVCGPLPSAELIRRVVPLMGHGWAVEGRPLVDADFGSMLAEVSAELRALDLLAGDRATWEAGPSARTLLPRATAAADLWTREPAW